MESCSLCQGKMRYKKVDVIKKINGKLVVIDKVPAYICNQGGEKYFSLKVVENIEKLIEKIENDKIKINIIQGVELKYELISV